MKGGFGFGCPCQRLSASTPEQRVHIQHTGVMTGPNSTLREWNHRWRMALVVLLVTLPAVVHAQVGKSFKMPANQNRVERGKYIVEGVAMCGMCHTPRNGSGELERGQWLDGAALWLLPARPVGDWPLKAPRIAGSPAASDEDLIRLLTTGIGKPVRDCAIQCHSFE